MHSDQDIETRATQIIDHAQTLKPAERDDYLEAQYQHDPILRARVQARLARHPASKNECQNPDGLQSAIANGDLPSRPLQRDMIEEGTAIGPYTVECLLGSGGFGAVYLAQQEEPIRRQVALKILKVGMDTAEIVQRFEAEEQALALMSHPGIASVFDVGMTERGRPYFAMEYVPGVSLGRFCDRERLNTNDRVRLFIDVCNAMQHAHQKGIIHRDLKPSNIMVMMQDGRPQPKIIDFGIAKAVFSPLTDHSMVTDAGHAIGTPEYMSPEQAQTNSDDVDTRADVYSLGMVLYELLTGAMPHTLMRDRRPSVLELRDWVLNGETIRLSTRIAMLGDEAAELADKRRSTPTTLRKQLRGELEWITLKSLERDRNRRYGSVYEFGADLQRYLNDEPVIAGPPTTAYRAQKFIARHRGGVFAGVAMSAALLAGIAIATVGFVSANEAANDARRAEQATKSAMARVVEERTNAETARILAEQDAIRAHEVSRFLERVLTSVDPGIAGPTVRMLDVLQQAEADLAHDEFSDPITGATVRGAIGESYRALAEYDDATEHLKARATQFELLFGPDDVRTLQARLAVGGNLRSLGHYDEARTLLESVRSALESQQGPSGPDTLTALGHLGRLELETGNLEAAETLFREVLDRTIALNPSPAELARARADFGWALMDQHKLAEAEQYLRMASDTLLEAEGPTHPTTLRVRDSLAVTLQNLGRRDEAIEIYDEILAIRREQMGESNPLTLWAMNNLGTALSETPSRVDEGRVMMERVLELQRERYGNAHLYSITTMNNLASIYRKLGRKDEAEVLWSEATTHGEALWGPTHPRTLGTITNRAGLISEMGRWDEARERFEYALPLMEKTLGKSHGMWLTAKHGLGVTLVRMELFDDALACFGELMTEAEAVLPEGHWYLHQFRSWRGIALTGLERYDEAETVLRASMDGLITQFGQDHDRSLGVRSKLVELYEITGNADALAALRAEYPDPE